MIPVPKLYVARLLPEPVMVLIRERFSLTAPPQVSPPSRAALLKGLREAHAAVCTLTEVIDGNVLKAAPDLRVIANYAVGYNNIAVKEAKARGIVVTNTPDVLTETTADLTWALLLATARRVLEGDRLARSGTWTGWEPTQLLGTDVYGKTLGIIGMGRIGRAVARRAMGFNMRVLYHDTVRADAAAERELRATYMDRDALLRESDFVSLHALFIPETKHLLNERTLRLMKKTAILVNAARGPIVDEAALARALKEGWIAGAGLDVFEEEPKIHPGLLSLTN